MTINTTDDFVTRSAWQTGSVMVAGAIRRSRLPTPAFVAFAVIHGVGTTAITKGLEFIEKKIGLIPKTDTDKKILAVANFILSQAIGIGLTCLFIQSLASVGFSLLYDMNRASLSGYDFGSVFCIAGQTTLVTLFALTIKEMKDLYNRVAA